MAHQDDIALMAHLMRRAGFGAGRDELEARVAKGYEATVEELQQPPERRSVNLRSLAQPARTSAATMAAVQVIRMACIGMGLNHFIVGITNSAPSLVPEGQRAVTVFVLV